MVGDVEIWFFFGKSGETEKSENRIDFQKKNNQSIFEIYVSQLYQKICRINAEIWWFEENADKNPQTG